MLTRPFATLGGLVVAVAVALCTPPAAVAVVSGDPVVCPPEQTVCTVTVSRPGSSGTGQGGDKAAPASAPRCRIPEFMLGAGDPMPCSDSQFGTWNNGDGCYYKILQPQPPASDPVWEGHYPDGAIYEFVCFGIIGTGGGWAWRATPPAGLGGRIDPAVLARRAIDLLRLEGPSIGMAPRPGSTGLVGVPVWMWTAVTPRTWGPASATASVPGLSVTATARAARIVWSMGDGHSVTCTGPGTPYAESLGAKASPTCGYLYATSSARQPGAKYAVTATTTWNVTWSGGGQSGALTVTRASTTRVSIGELQVLVT